MGREEEIAEVKKLLHGNRLVTLSGPGGVGKTRLAVAVGERLRDRFAAGIVFVPLAAVARPELALGGIARAVGADLAGTRAPLEALAEQFGNDRWLLVLDNLDQVTAVAGDLGELLGRCPGVAILATSRTVLGLGAEREYPVAPLPLPGDGAGGAVEALLASPAVALFVERARAVRPSFALTEANAWAVVELCRRLEGLPLAIELAAARTRLLDPDAILGRLATSLDALGTGAVDLPRRQRTLRATVDWSVDLLAEDERSLLEATAIFVDGWTLQAAAQVAGLDEDQVLELSEALARHSLIYLDRTELGSRLRMLETVREFVAERLGARPDLAEIQRHHAEYYRGLGEQADLWLRGVGLGEWLERLEAEAGNLAAAVGWYLAHDPTPLPHLFRVLAVLVAAGPPGRGPRLGRPAAARHRYPRPPGPRRTGVDGAGDRRRVGDDSAVLAARQRLEPLLEGIDDPYLRAVSKLALAWTAPVVGDLDAALRGALASLEQLRGQDEPYWTALALGTAGLVETTAGRHDDAQRHLREARDLGKRFDDAWLAAWSRVLLGTLAVARGRLEEARALLEEGLELSLAAHSTRSVTLCLTAFAQLAFVEGDAKLAALLAGATEGLRRRVGVRAWPLLRRPEAELLARVRPALGADRFEEVFAASARLTQQEAVAAARDRRTTGAATS